MSTRKRKVEDAKNGKEESTPKRSTPDVSLSQPDIGKKRLLAICLQHRRTTSVVTDLCHTRWKISIRKLRNLVYQNQQTNLEVRKPHLLI